MSGLRIRLIEQLCKLPEKQLMQVEQFLRELDAKYIATVCDAHKDWPHAPIHRLSDHGAYIVTAATMDKQHFFRGDERLTLLQDEMLKLAKECDILLEAWAVFSNHYHFVAHTSGAGNQLAEFLSRLHTITATEINRLDKAPGRQVWFNYWETLLTFEKSYLARLHYVHQNAVKHGLVRVAKEYRWCSAAWFERTATASQIKTIQSFKIDRLNVADDYEPM